MTGRFKPRPVSTRYPGGVRIDVAQDGAMSVYRAGRPYKPGTVGHYLTSRRAG